MARLDISEPLFFRLVSIAHLTQLHRKLTEQLPLFQLSLKSVLITLFRSRLFVQVQNVDGSLPPAELKQ
jgi:hypothetical protein